MMAIVAPLLLFVAAGGMQELEGPSSCGAAVPAESEHCLIQHLKGNTGTLTTMTQHSPRTTDGGLVPAKPSARHNSIYQAFQPLVSPLSSKFRLLEQEGASQGLEDGIFVIVPGLGSYDRATLVQSNIAWLRQQGVNFDCVIYVYRNTTVFHLEEEKYAPCTLIRHEGYWMNHLRDVQLNKNRRRWILHLMDSVEPDKTNLSLNRIIEIMRVNNLSHAAPAMPNNKYELMKTHEDRPGRFVSFIELQMDMFTREYFACLQDVASDENRMGWGVDRLLPSLCPGNMGVIDEMTMWKTSTQSYNYTDAEQSMQNFLWYAQGMNPGLYPVNTYSTLGVLADPLG